MSHEPIVRRSGGDSGDCSIGCGGSGIGGVAGGGSNRGIGGMNRGGIGGDTLGSEVLGPGSGNSWLVNWNAEKVF